MVRIWRSTSFQLLTAAVRALVSLKAVLLRKRPIVFAPVPLLPQQAMHTKRDHAVIQVWLMHVMAADPFE